jgi:hypothetical protein
LSADLDKKGEDYSTRIFNKVNGVIPYLQLDLLGDREELGKLYATYIYNELLLDEPSIPHIQAAAEIAGLSDLEINGIKISELSPEDIEKVQQVAREQEELFEDAPSEEIEENIDGISTVRSEDDVASVVDSPSSSPATAKRGATVRSRDDVASVAGSPSPVADARPSGSVSPSAMKRYGRNTAATGTAAIPMAPAAVDPALQAELSKYSRFGRTKAETELVRSIIKRHKLNPAQQEAVQVIIRQLTEEKPDLKLIARMRRLAGLPGEIKFGGVKLDELDSSNIDKAADAVSRELADREVTVAWGIGFDRSFSSGEKAVINNPVVVTVGRGTWTSPGDTTTKVILGLAVRELMAGTDDHSRGLRYYQALGAHRSLNAGSMIGGEHLTSSLTKAELDGMQEAVDLAYSRPRSRSLASSDDDKSTVRSAEVLSTTSRPTKAVRTADRGTGRGTSRSRSPLVAGAGGDASTVRSAGASPTTLRGVRFSRAAAGADTASTRSDTLSARTGSVRGYDEASASVSDASPVGRGAAHRTTAAGTRAPLTSSAGGTGMRGSRGALVGSRSASRSFDEESVHTAISEGLDSAVGGGSLATAAAGRKVRGPGLTTHTSTRAVPGTTMSAAGVTAAMGAHYSEVFEKMLAYYAEVDTTPKSKNVEHPYSDAKTAGIAEITGLKPADKENQERVLREYLSSPLDPDDKHYKAFGSIAQKAQVLIRSRRQEMNEITRKLVSHDSPDLKVGKDKEVIDFGDGCKVVAQIDISSGKRVLTRLTPNLDQAPARGETPEPITITLPRIMTDGKKSDKYFDVVEFTWQNGKYKASKMSVLGGPNVGESQISLTEQHRLAKEVEAAKGGRNLGAELPGSGMAARRGGKAPDPAALVASVTSTRATAATPSSPSTPKRRGGSSLPYSGGGFTRF